MKAYSYTIFDKLTNIYYYGVRKSNNFDLFESYFSSSKIINQLIKDHGTERFDIKLRKKFNSYEEARLHECNFLQRVNAITNPKFYNQAISSPRICAKNSAAEKLRREKISKSMLLRWQDPHYKDKHPFVNLSVAESSKRGKKGAAQRIANYKSGKIKRKPRKKKFYPVVTIIKNEVTKEIRSNQVPAYRKYGWERL